MSRVERQYLHCEEYMIRNFRRIVILCGFLLCVRSRCSRNAESPGNAGTASSDAAASTAA